MNDFIYRNTCPVCGSGNLSAVFSAKDHTVSGKYFEIIECRNCTVRFTQDVPGENAIDSYYQSESYISHSDTSMGLVNRLYKMVRKLTLGQKRKLVERHTCQKKGALLDIGSGTGFFPAEMKKKGWQVTGLEPGKAARDFAHKYNEIELKDIKDLYQLSPGCYDAITLWHVLEHVHDLRGYIEKFNDLLKNSGKLFVAVPNYTSHDAGVFREYWAAYDVPRHLYHFSPRGMKKLMEDGGLKIEKIYPMWFDSFYVSLLSSKYKKGKTQWITAYITACISNFKALVNREKCSSLVYVIKKMS